MITDNAKPVKNTGDKFAAYTSSIPGGCALVQVYRRLPGYNIDLTTEVAEYETMAKGASASARREIRKLEKEQK